MQICEYFFENACYSVTKYYLCKQNNKRSLLGRKQQSQVARSFPNRYLFSYTDKVTSLFSISCILDIILQGKRASFTTQKGVDRKTKGKEIDKNNPQNTASPSPKVMPPQAPPKEGMCLAGYRMLWVGEIKGKSIKAKSPWVNSQRSKVFEVKICFVTHNSPIC